MRHVMFAIQYTVAFTHTQDALHTAPIDEHSIAHFSISHCRNRITSSPLGDDA